MEEEKEVWKRLTADNGDELRFSNLGRYQKEVDGEWVDQKLKYDRCNGYYWLPQHVLMRHLPTLHVVIAHLFVENTDPSHKYVVDHKDGDKLNNRASNLEWVSQTENLRRWRERGGKAKRCSFRCIETDQVFPSMSAVAKFFNRRYCSVQTILRSDNKEINGYHFEEVVE